MMALPENQYLWPRSINHRNCSIPHGICQYSFCTLPTLAYIQSNANITGKHAKAHNITPIVAMSEKTSPYKFAQLLQTAKLEANSISTLKNWNKCWKIF